VFVVLNKSQVSRRTLFIFSALLLASCSTTASQTVGFVRDEPLDVSRVFIDEQTNSMQATPFNTVAPAGELLILFFGYTNCPDLCPTTLADIRAAFARIGDDSKKVSVAFVTVDPERDTADRLTSYLASFVDRFHVLRTTDMKQLQLAKDAFLAYSAIRNNSDGSVEVSHTATTYIIDESGFVIDEIPFGVGADGFENDLRILLKKIK